MILYNTLGQKKMEFVPHSGKKVNMYTCGPTVYHFAHIGNLRTYIMEDVLERYLRYDGYDVTRVMNITETNRYGTMVTILLGNYYEITYGQVTVNNLEIGDEVKRGETIAQVAEPTHSFVEEGSHLYMKMTLKGEPVNPALYLES